MLSRKFADSASGWNIDKLKFNSTLDRAYLAPQEINVGDVFFKPDGLIMYIVGDTSDRVHQYTLSSPWALHTAVASESISVNVQDNNPTGLFFKPDGTKMYVIGSENDRVREYNLSTPWRVSTATFLQSSIVIADSTPQGVFFRDDGLKMYVAGDTNDKVYEYTLSTAWNVATATFVRDYTVSGQTSSPNGLTFSSDGLRMYIVDGSRVYQYGLAVAWSLASGFVAFVRSWSVTGQGGASLGCRGIFMKSDGTEIYIADQSNNEAIHGYYLSTPYNISTAVWVAPTTNFYNPSPATRGHAVFFKPDGLKMYIDKSTTGVSEYNLSTAWDITTATFLQSDSNIDERVQGIFFKEDGTRVYVTYERGGPGQHGEIKQFNLSTPWNITTGSLASTFDISLTVNDSVNDAFNIFFKPDGLTMWVTDSSNIIRIYNLSTAWTLSTATFSSRLIASGGITGIFFKEDGTRLFTVDETDGFITQYNLPSPWTAPAGGLLANSPYISKYDASNYDRDPQSIFFKPGGKKMYLSGNRYLQIFSFDIR